MSRSKDGSEGKVARRAGEPSRLAIDRPLSQRLLNERVLLGPLELLSHEADGGLYEQSSLGQRPTLRVRGRGSTHPTDDEIRRAAVDQRADTAL